MNKPDKNHAVVKGEAAQREKRLHERRLAELRQGVAELEASETEQMQAEETIAYQATLVQNVTDAIFSTERKFADFGRCIII